MRVLLSLNRLSALLFALTCFSGTAFADWQGTVWNSTPAQADKDFRVPHRTATQAEYQNYFNRALFAFDNYQVGDLAFYKGALLFEDGTLKEIWMSLKDPWQCNKLIAVLRATYGQPAEEENRIYGRTVIWYDQKHNNQVNVFYRKWSPETQMIDDCDLKYEPFIVPSPGQL